MKANLEAALRDGVEELEEPITFYSNGCAHFTTTISVGAMKETAPGRVERIGEKEAVFHGIPNGVKQPDGSVKYFGYFVTRDPETALKLLINGYFPDRKRGNRILGDVILSADYEEQITPSDELIRRERARVIATENELANYMNRNDQAQQDLQASQSENAKLREQLAELMKKNGKKEAVPA